MATTKKSTNTATATQTTETVMNDPTTTTPAANPPSPIFINPPPANAMIPAPDAGWKPPKGNPYRGVKPTKPELVALPDAIEELRTFGAYTATFASLVPPQDQVVQIFDAALQWSKMLGATDLWDKYCKIEEGVVWTTVRLFMARLLPAFQLALLSNPSLATELPKLATFLGVKKAVAKQAASTRAANKSAVARGEQPFHGTAGKKRKAKAEKAAAAAAAAAQQKQNQQPPASPPAVVVTKQDPPPVTNGTNGTAHN